MKTIREYFIGLLVMLLLLAACMGDGDKQVVSSYLDGTPQYVRYISVKGQDTAVSKEVFYYQNGKKRLEGTFDEDSLYHGIWTGWYFDGTKNYEASFNHGIRDGSWNVWDFDGDLRGDRRVEVEEFRDAFPEVIRFIDFEADSAMEAGQILFYENHCRKSEGKIKSDKKHGHWIAWRRDGTKWSEGDFQYDLNHGWHTVYHENSRKFYEGEYRLGDRIGIWKIWNEDGKLIRETEYEWD